MFNSSLRAVALWLAILVSPVHAFTHGEGWPNPVGVNWSTLGVVADGVTDNTAALNALPTNTTIIGDCPASAAHNGAPIRLNGQVFLTSNITIYQRPECSIQCYYQNVNLNLSCITQADLTNPISNIFWYGYRISKPDLTYQNRMLMLWVDHAQFLQFRINNYKQAFYIRGSDQEFGGCFATNSLAQVGSDFIRQIGNVPVQTTTTGKPASVWMHGCYAYCGDACYQIAQPGNIIPAFFNVSTNGVLVEDNFGQSSNSNLLLIGENCSVAQCNNYDMDNVTARNLRGSGIQTCVIMSQAVGNPNVWSNITLQNITCDGSPDVASPSGLFNLDSSASTSVIDHVTLDGLVANNPRSRSLVVDGYYTNLTVKNGTFNTPRVSGLPPVFFGQHIAGLTVQNNAISSLVASTMVLGGGTDPTAQLTGGTVSGNTITNVFSNQNGIWLQAVNGATITGNSVVQATGSTNVHAMALTTAGATAGTTNTTATGNNFSGVSGSAQVVCATGQGNSVTGNTGAANCAP